MYLKQTRRHWVNERSKRADLTLVIVSIKNFNSSRYRSNPALDDTNSLTASLLTDLSNTGQIPHEYLNEV